MFKPDLYFHRALCYFKLDKPTEALCDLYTAFQSTQIQSLDRIHVQILEEIKKYLKNNKLKDGHIMTKENNQVSFSEILQQYEMEICQYIKQQMDRQRDEDEEVVGGGGPSGSGSGGPSGTGGRRYMDPPHKMNHDTSRRYSQSFPRFTSSYSSRRPQLPPANVIQFSGGSDGRVGGKFPGKPSNHNNSRPRIVNRHPPPPSHQHQPQQHPSSIPATYRNRMLGQRNNTSTQPIKRRLLNNNNFPLIGNSGHELLDNKSNVSVLCSPPFLLPLSHTN